MGELSRPENGSRAPDQPAQASRPETQATGQAGDSRGNGRGPGPAEILTREQYARQMRDRPPGQRGTDARAGAAPDAPAGTPQHGDRQLAEPRSRAEVAREARARTVRPEEQPRPDRPATVAPAPASRPDRGTQARGHPGQAAEARRPATAVTHFHGEFKAQRLDLYTDGNGWATADSTRREQTTAKKGDIPARLPAGQELVDSAADNNPSRADRIRSKLYEQSDDALDTLEKNANIGESIFARPPTGSYEGTPTRQPHIYETQPAGIDAGSVATAIFTLGLVIDRAAHRAVEYYEKHAKGR